MTFKSENYKRIERKTVQGIKRERSSANGNPRFTVTFTDGTSAKTPVDGQVGYKIGSYYEGREIRAEFDVKGQLLDFSE